MLKVANEVDSSSSQLQANNVNINDSKPSLIIIFIIIMSLFIGRIMNYLSVLMTF